MDAKLAQDDCRIDLNSGSSRFGRIIINADKVRLESWQGGKFETDLKFPNWSATLKFFAAVAYQFSALSEKSESFKSALQESWLGSDARIRDPRFWLAPTGASINNLHEAVWRELDALYLDSPVYTGPIKFGSVELLESENGAVSFGLSDTAWSHKDLIGITAIILGHDRNNSNDDSSYYSPFLIGCLQKLEENCPTLSTISPAKPLNDIIQSSAAVQLSTESFSPGNSAIYEEIVARGSLVIDKYQF